MASFSYHINQSFWAIATKNIKFVEVNTKNISANPQSYIPYGFWGDFFLFFFFFFYILVPLATNQNEHWAKLFNKIADT